MVTTAAASRLLERERELDALARAARDAAAGHGSAWLVCAEAGGGKTRLLREATRAAGLPSRWGTAEPVVPPDPYLPVMQALRGFRPAARRADSVDRAVARLEELADGGPITLVFDDLHFADEGTIAVFLRLASLGRDRPWLVLGAVRPGEGPDAVRTALTELVAQSQARRLDLPPLTRDGVVTLLTRLRGRPVEDGEVDAAFADSGGNPWFVEALACGTDGLAATRDRVLLRLDRLDRALPGTRDLLNQLAPAGEPLPHGVVAALVGGDGPELRRLLRNLRNAGVLVERSGAWQFRHELLRRTVLDDLLHAERRDAHRHLAEAMEDVGRHGAQPGSRLPLVPSPSQLAMHFAAAGDSRAAPWAARAAREASAVDAHAEALAQAERALQFDPEPEVRRSALHAATRATYHLGRFDESLRYAEAALAIGGGDPETRAWLHQRAIDAAHLSGDVRGASRHLETAEQALAGRPVTRSMVNLAVLRVRHSAFIAEPEQAAVAAERALSLAGQLANPTMRVAYELDARACLGLTQLHAGNASGIGAWEAVADLGDAYPNMSREVVAGLIHGYGALVLGLYHPAATRLWLRVAAGMHRHELRWAWQAEAYRTLELVQRGRYTDAAAPAGAAMPTPGAVPHAALLCANVLREARAGSLVRARALLAGAPVTDCFADAVVFELAALEIAALTGEGDSVARAADVYERMHARRCARVAGMAAVALARAGMEVPSRPAWLPAGSPLGVLWEWASAIERGDADVLRAVATGLDAMDCPYEAALALRDAGDLSETYRRLRSLGATTMREQVARQLRAEGGSIPRGPRAEAGTFALTDTERAVCRLVAGGATNRAAAAALGIGVSTVEAHLSRIYQKSGNRGRAALAAWWTEQAAGR